MADIKTDDLLKQLLDASDIDSFLSEHKQNQIDITLSEFLNGLLEQKKLSKADVIGKSGLSENYAYQIFSGKKANPSQNKVIQLAIGMSLNLIEVQKLLHIAKLPQLYVKVKRDSVIIHAINEQLNIMQTNELLHHYQLDLLSNE